MNKHTNIGLVVLNIEELRDKYSNYCAKVRKMDPVTIAHQQVYLDRIFNALKISDSNDLKKYVTHTSVSGFVIEYSQNYGPGSCSWLKFTLRSFLRFCCLYELLGNDLSYLVPADRRWRLAHLPKSIDDKYIVAIMSTINGSSAYDLRDSAIVTLLVTYGVRGVQLRHLCLDDIDWENEVIHFPAAKNGRPVSQPITMEVGNALAAYLMNGRPKTIYREVFLTIRGDVHPFSGSEHLSSLLKRKFEQTGIVLPEGVSYGTHGFRHSFASRLVGKIPFKSLNDMLGHRDPSSTLMYGKVAFSSLQEAALPWPEDKRS